MNLQKKGYTACANDKEYFIDLLFFNRRMQSLVAVELKIGEFKPEYVGKMNFYLNLLDDFVRESNENPSVGIILCKGKSTFEVDYALAGMEKPMGVANYELRKTLPESYENKLPNIELLKNELNRQIQDV